MSDIVERLRAGFQCAESGNRCRTMDAQSGCVCAAAADRIEQLEAALRAVMDDLTLIGKNHWLPVGLLDDVIYVNAHAALGEERT